MIKEISNSALIGIMESKCPSFKLFGGICDYDKRYPSSDTVPLSSCERGLGEYVRGVGISDISAEVELIRAFTFSVKLSFLCCP